MSAGKRKTDIRRVFIRKTPPKRIRRRTVPFPYRSLFVIGNQVCTSPLTACQQARAKTDIRRVFIRKTPPKRIRRRTVPFPYRSLFVIGNQVCTSPLTACQTVYSSFALFILIFGIITHTYKKGNYSQSV